jgi:uncharacterized membrane protein
MSNGVFRTLTVVGLLGSGLMAGLFFVFSTSIMKSLKDLPSSQGIAAMQSINVAVPGSALFLLVFVGTALACVALTVSALFRLDDVGARYQLVASVLYLVMIVVTAAYHVPHNDALAKIDPTSAGAARYWSNYLTGWNAWNHVRTITSFAAMAVFAVALRVG